VPAIVLGGLFGSWIKEKLYCIGTVVTALALGGVLLIFLERIRRSPKYTEIRSMPPLRILGIGLAQAFAMIPGVSRSAATIIGALLLGMSRELAVEYSFYLAIPTMFAASAYSLLKEGASLSGAEWLAVAAGFVVAFLVAWAVIAFFMSYIRKRDFRVFGWYRIALSAVILVWLCFCKR
jgi:undecaprenyl-diphosphatase